MGVVPFLLIVGFVMVPSEFGFLYCFLLIVDVSLFFLILGFAMFPSDCGFRPNLEFCTVLLFVVDYVVIPSDFGCNTLPPDCEVFYCSSSLWILQCFLLILAFKLFPPACLYCFPLIVG